MLRYRKKPVVIDATPYTGDNAADVLFWMGSFPDAKLRERPALVREDGVFVIRTLEGDHEGTPGDMVIRGVAGEFYFCKPEIFAATYEPAD